MTENDRMLYKLLAFLLEYPTPAWNEDLADVSAIVESLDDLERRQRLQNFLIYTKKTPVIEVQETYTAAFDLDPATSLHLTYHLMGDSEDRGKALARLLWVYHHAGFDAAIGELPDFLPMILEFLALCPETENADILWSCLATVTPLAERLETIKHPYSGLVELAADIVQPYLDIHSGSINKED